MPFELPNGWEWVNLGTVCDVFGRIGFRGYTKGDFVSKGEGAISLSPSNIVNNSMNYDNCSYITWQKYEESPEIMIYNGDILLVKTGSSYGKSTIVQNLPEKATINPQFVVLKNSRIITSYLCYFLQSPYCISMYEKFVGGTAIPTFSQANLKAMYIAVPPIQEQSRIVSAIRTAEEQIILIGDNNNELQTDINLLKSKILDLAIRGKLVPQDPNDEPASILLERIRAEKEELIKQGKIKRDKKESIIFKGEDNSYYENLPENWCVSCLAEITNPSLLNDGDWILSENMDSNGTVKLIQLGSIGFMNYINKGFKFITDNTFIDLSCTQIYPTYLLINRIINDRMCLCILPNIEGKLITTVDTCWIAPNPNYEIKYLMYAMASPQFQSLVIKHSTGVTRKRISKNNLIKLPLLLPPLAEQKRIVHHVDILFEIINAIEKSLN